MKVKFVKKIVKLIIIEFPEGFGVQTNIPSRRKVKGFWHLQNPWWKPAPSVSLGIPHTVSHLISGNILVKEDKGMSIKTVREMG